jgi:putative lipoic acid-binding regulatory protein
MKFTTQDLQNANPEHGFSFPGTFELSAMGPVAASLDTVLPELLEAAGIAVLREQVSVRESSAGRYCSVRIAFQADSREQYDAAHAALRSHPEVKWTI